MLFINRRFSIAVVFILAFLSLTVDASHKKSKSKSKTKSTTKSTSKVCKQTRTELGDDCDSIASRCGISKRKLIKYNPDWEVCNMDLVPSGLPLCCSPGNLPFPLPVNDDDGTCATYITQENESCADIAMRFQLPMSFLEKINKQASWGWMGCDKLLPNQPMCLSNGTAPDDSADPDDETLIPNDCGASPYNTLADVDAALTAATADTQCLTQYTLEVLQKNLQSSLDRYNNIMADHYDTKFNTFASALVANAPRQVHDFVLAHGSSYFTCVVTELQLCCADSCQSVNTDPNGTCRYCYPGKCDMVDFMGRPLLHRRDSGGVGVILGGGDHPGDGSHSVSRVTNVSEPCPPDYSLRGLSQKQQPQERRDTVYWSLLPERADQFYADIYAATGLASERISLQDIYHLGDCPPQGNCRDNGWDIGIPAPNGYSTADVANPKDVVVAALTNLTSLQAQISGVLEEMRGGRFLGSGDDVVDAVAVPVLMISSAVDNMDMVVDTAAMAAVLACPEVGKTAGGAGEPVDTEDDAPEADETEGLSGAGTAIGRDEASTPSGVAPAPEDHAFSDMLRRAARERDVPVAAFSDPGSVAVADQELARGLALVERAGGQTIRRARVAARQVLAERDRVLAEPVATRLPPIAPEKLAGTIEALTAMLDPGPGATSRTPAMAAPGAAASGTEAVPPPAARPEPAAEASARPVVPV